MRRVFIFLVMFVFYPWVTFCHKPTEPAVFLEIEVEGSTVRAYWEANFPVAEYILFYAPYPEKEPVFYVSLGKTTFIEVNLPVPSAYYVAIGAKSEDGQFYVSNIEYFRVTNIWRPLPGTTWQWQLTGPIDTSVEAEMFDIDLFDTSKETISKLHQQNKIVICYFSAGSYENWRSDKDKFKESDLGNSLDEWEGERWLDIRSDNVKKIMKERLDLAKSKKCDGVEMDNVDGAANNTGFDFDFDDQIEYNRFLAIEGKKRGLLVGLKNDLEQVDELVDYFDFSVNEECNEYNECDLLEPFIKQNKPVFNAEYNKKYYDNFDELCQASKTHKLQTLLLPKELNGSWVKSCNY